MPVCPLFLSCSVQNAITSVFFVVLPGKKGGHKGRMRTYTSPEEIDAQMKAEKERRKVGGVYTQSCPTQVDRLETTLPTMQRENSWKE